MRQDKVVTIHDVERDLTFKIRQMPAWQGLLWTEKVALILGKNPDFFKLFEGTNQDQQAGSIISALCSSVEFDKAAPLQEELLRCCSRIDAGIEQLCTPDSISGFIDSPRTIWLLLVEAFKVNISFFQIAGPSNSPTSDIADSGANNRPAQSPIRMSQASSAR